VLPQAVRSARRIPVSLVALLAVALVVELAWAFVQPPWQAPDEQVHFAYAQELAADGALAGDASKAPFSTDQSLALGATDLNGVALHPQVPAVWDPGTVRRWRAQQAALSPAARHDGGGPNSAAPNPPLYYSYLAPAYWAASAAHATVIGHLYALRIWSGLLLLVTVTATWLLAGELFDRRRIAQVTAAGIVALQPETTFITAMTNPDALLVALWSLGAWLGVRILRRGLTLRSGVAIGLVGAAAVLTKATGYALLIGVVAVLALSGWRLARRRSIRWRSTLAICLAVSVLPVLAWVATAHALHRPVVNQVSVGGPAITPLSMDYADFARYLKRFYVPRLSPHAIEQGPAASLWLDGGWGRFGFVDVQLPRGVQHALELLSLLALAGAVVYVLRRRGPDRRALAYLAGLALLLLAALHYADFQQIVAAQRAGQPPPAFMQGRYILPIVPLLACAATAALAVLPRRLRAPATGVVLGGMWCLEVLSLGLVMERYFA
jgi:4-amino-4-deoxy-L-arabinose transferase-like glycosyltransferase